MKEQNQYVVRVGKDDLKCKHVPLHVILIGAPGSNVEAL